MEKLLLSVDEAAKALSIGRTKLYAEMSAGGIKAIKLGKRTLISKNEIEAYISNLDTYAAERSS